ncbi:hypothetical protein BMETH_2611101826, partial [methanotrophic bacterial endosymbiont of Bathymodiolus sp.]
LLYVFALPLKYVPMYKFKLLVDNSLVVFYWFNLLF